MASPGANKKGGKSKAEQPLDQKINDLINQRRVQQEALLKIKASVAKRQSSRKKDN